MQLRDLPEAEQVARLERLARGALAAWSLTDAEIAPIKYRENAVFRVASRDGAHFVLRVHRPAYRSDAHIRSEVAWMRALAESGVPTPDFLPTRAGDVLCVAAAEGVPEPRQCDLMAWVEGRPIGTLEGGVDLEEEALRRTYRTVGEIAARMHAHAASWQAPADFARPAWDVDTLVGDAPVFGRFWELEAISPERLALLLRARDRARERLAAFGASPEQYGLVHGDLVPDNLLAEDAVVRAIDFDDCGFTWYGFELATSLFPLLVSGGFEVALAGYLEGYRSLRPWPDEAIGPIADFLMARALSYLGWPVGRPEIHSQQALVPFLVEVVTGLADRYLADALA